MRNSCNNVSTVKRQNIIREYEEVKAKTRKVIAENCGKAYYVFEVKYGKHNGFYSSDEISEFKECTISSRVVYQRLSKMRIKEGSFITIEEAIKTPLDERTSKNNNELLKERLSKQDKDMIWFNTYIKLMKPGSLAHTVR